MKGEIKSKKKKEGNKRECQVDRRKELKSVSKWWGSATIKADILLSLYIYIML